MGPDLIGALGELRERKTGGYRRTADGERRTYYHMSDDGVASRYRGFSTARDSAENCHHRDIGQHRNQEREPRLPHGSLTHVPLERHPVPADRARQFSAIGDEAASRTGLHERSNAAGGMGCTSYSRFSLRGRAPGGLAAKTRLPW